MGPFKTLLVRFIIAYLTFSRWQPTRLEMGNFNARTVDKNSHTLKQLLNGAHIYTPFHKVLLYSANNIQSDHPSPIIQAAWRYAEVERGRLLNEFEKLYELEPNSIGSGQYFSSEKTRNYLRKNMESFHQQEEVPEFIRQSWGISKLRLRDE